jgi:hypothetical protein
MPQTLEKTRPRTPHVRPVKVRARRSFRFPRPLFGIALAAIFVLASRAAGRKTSLSIDLTGDLRAAAQTLLDNSAFVAAESGDRICDTPCRLRMTLNEAGSLDHAFSLAAVSETDGRATSVLLRTAPTSLSSAYDEATEMLVSLAFADQELALLDDWFRRTKNDARAAQSFLAHRQVADCSLRLGILRADQDRRWKIALELSFD